MEVGRKGQQWGERPVSGGGGTAGDQGKAKPWEQQPRGWETKLAVCTPRVTSELADLASLLENRVANTLMQGKFQGEHVSK